MDKNDKLKEELAESRHDDLLGVALGAFGFAGISVAIAYWQTLGWSSGLMFALLLVAVLVGVGSVANRKKRKREKLIEKLDNEEQKPMPESSIKEPTNQDI